MTAAPRWADDVSLADRGRALAAFRLLGPIGAAARLRSPAARRYIELLHDPGARAEEERAIRASVPVEVARIDPSWYVAPPRTRSAAARRYLERVAYGHLVSMRPPEAPGEPADPAPGRTHAARRVERLLEGPIDRLHAALHALGRRRVAIAFTGAPKSALAQLLARLGEPAAGELVAEVRAVPPGVSADEVKAAQRALFQGGKGPAPGEPAALFFRRVGCGWLAPLVDAEGDRARRLAQRLPRTLGEVILTERAQPMSEAARAAIVRICAQA